MRGAGTVYARRKNGKVVGYAAQESITENGHRKRPTVYGATKAEVRTKLHELRQRIEAGVSTQPTSHEALERFLYRWLEAVTPSVREGTHVGYEIHVRRHLVPTLGHLQLRDLRPEHVQLALNRLAVSPRTVRHIRATLRAALNVAMDWQAVDRNAAARGIRLPVLPHRPIRALDEGQVARLLKAARGDRLYPLWVVLLGCGLRLGEGLGLHWEDVDWQNNRLRIERSLQRIDGKLVLAPTKTDGSAAVLPMPSVVAAALREIPRPVDGGLIFQTRTGEGLDQSNVRREWKKLLRKAGLPRFRIHDLRHSCATLLLARGVHLKVVSELLRHADPSLTLKTYSHVTAGRLDAAALEIDAAIAR